MKFVIQPYMRERAERERERTGTYPQWWLDMQPKRAKKTRAAATSPKPQTARRTRKRTDYEGELARQINLAGLPEPQAQFRWHPTRQFRADFAYPDQRILIEVQGGIYMQDSGTGEGGGHNRGKGYESDRAKYAMAQIIGWMVLEFGPNHITSGEALATIETALKAKSDQ